MGFHPIAEIQPSRHRVSLPLAQGTDDEAVRATLAKSTRQRIAGAERDGLIVERHDRAGWEGMDRLFERPGRSAEEALEAFATLLEGTGSGEAGSGRATCSCGAVVGRARLVYLDARDPADKPATLGGLILYRHGNLLDGPLRPAAGPRRSHPGVMHLAAGGRSSSPSARAATRWTSAASIRGQTTPNRARAIRWLASTSTSAPSEHPGWR